MFWHPATARHQANNITAACKGEHTARLTQSSEPTLLLKVGIHFHRNYIASGNNYCLNKLIDLIYFGHFFLCQMYQYKVWYIIDSKQLSMILEQNSLKKTKKLSDILNHCNLIEAISESWTAGNKYKGQRCYMCKWHTDLLSVVFKNIHVWVCV